MIPTNINVNIVNIIITRLDVLVKADDKREEEDDDDASSSSVLEQLFLFKKRLKLLAEIITSFRTRSRYVKRSSDRRSSSSFIVFSLKLAQSDEFSRKHVVDTFSRFCVRKTLT